MIGVGWKFLSTCIISCTKKIRLIQIPCVRVDLEDHVACGVPNFGVRVGGAVVEYMQKLHMCVLCGG
jgi:hypothetical protein